MFAVYYYYAGCLFLQLLDIIVHICKILHRIAYTSVNVNRLCLPTKTARIADSATAFDKSIFSTIDVNRFA